MPSPRDPATTGRSKNESNIAIMFLSRINLCPHSVSREDFRVRGNVGGPDGQPGPHDLHELPVHLRVARLNEVLQGAAIEQFLVVPMLLFASVRLSKEKNQNIEPISNLKRSSHLKLVTFIEFQDGKKKSVQFEMRGQISIWERRKFLTNMEFDFQFFLLQCSARELLPFYLNTVIVFLCLKVETHHY